ncbi:MAG: lytic transglycosylase domain-containing protein [Geobacteraceae bacterium]
MSIRTIENLFPQTSGPVSVKSAAAASAGNEIAFAQLLAAAGKGETSRSTEPATLTARAELLRLRMMRDALTLDPAPQNSVTSYPGFLPENLLRALSSYRDAAGTVPQDFPEISPEVLAADVNSPRIAAAPDAKPLVVPGTIDEIISKAARRYQVDPGLIKAVIKAESNFNSNAVSPAGARGLMQLMPGTARGLGVTDSFNPEQNVMGGTRYLRQMLDRYDGNLESALAAYNWGPGNVDRRGDFLPRETREYLVKVKSLYSDYLG